MLWDRKFKSFIGIVPKEQRGFRAKLQVGKRCMYSDRQTDGQTDRQTESSGPPV